MSLYCYIFKRSSDNVLPSTRISEQLTGDGKHKFQVTVLTAYQGHDSDYSNAV